MKQHTSEFKNQVKNMGRQFRHIVTYENTTLVDELYEVIPVYEANLLKSVMKQLDIQCSVDIPKGTILNYRLGLLVGNSYEYLDFGNYVVYSSEKQEDENKYKIICYDKMLYAMKQNESLGVTYPISIKNYLSALATKIGLTLASGTFYNEDLEIAQELYAEFDYTYRDILDEIAQATGSIIVINNNDEIEVRYPNITNDTIDEEYLKDININFAEKYGPINSIVLSRAGESDNVYIKDDESIEENGLCEVKIVENQIMNWNDRSDYLQGIFDALGGLYYYENDFASTGVLYYDVGDVYNISIGDSNYQCIMLNDEIDVTSGIEELIHTEIPEQGQTDYTKADKTDRKVNSAYIVVDKVNREITEVVQSQEELEGMISDQRAQQTITNNEIMNLVSNTSTQIEQLNVDKVGSADYETTIPNIQTMIEQTNNQVEIRFQNMTTTTDNISNVITTNQELLEEYIRFQGALIELGRVGNDFTAQLSNTELAFLQNGVKIAYISNNKLYITDAEIQNKLTIGNFAFIPRENGNLSFTWIGG